MKTINDIYRCIACNGAVAHKHTYCRHCGAPFTASDLTTMRQKVHYSIGATPWNTRDRFRCIHCSAHVAITDAYCYGCGDFIDNHERQLMRLNMQELAKKNIPSLIGLGCFVLLVIYMCTLAVKSG